MLAFIIFSNASRYIFSKCNYYFNCRFFVSVWAAWRGLLAFSASDSRCRTLAAPCGLRVSVLVVLEPSGFPYAVLRLMALTSGTVLLVWDGKADLPCPVHDRAPRLHCCMVGSSWRASSLLGGTPVVKMAHGLNVCVCGWILARGANIFPRWWSRIVKIYKVYKLYKKYKIRIMEIIHIIE